MTQIAGDTDPARNQSATAIVLAAGAGTRFGGAKLIAPLDGRPILQHVLDALRAAGIDDPIVVLAAGDTELTKAVDWGRARRVRNSDPSRGLSSSLQIGWRAAIAGDPTPDRVLVVLGDQPTVPPTLYLRLLAEPLDPARPIVATRHLDGTPNPVRLEPSAAVLVAETSGDRGLGPLLERVPELVREIQVDHHNPDVDRREDLEALLDAAWAGRVRENAAQVERFRDAPDDPDFYAPVTAMFVADPERQDDPVVDALVAIADPRDVWLDVGAGAGRYALPIARVTRGVIAVDPSQAMLGALTRGAADHGIDNVRAVAGRWPPDADLRTSLGPDPIADVALIAHVGYDIEEIGPFLDEMEAAARRRCVAVLMESSPAAVAAPFWPLVHGVTRIGLPALPQFLELLAVRGAAPDVTMLAPDRRRWGTRDDLIGFLRRQLWTSPGTSSDARLLAAVAAITRTAADGSLELADAEPRAVGVVSWAPVGRPRRRD